MLRQVFGLRVIALLFCVCDLLFECARLLRYGNEFIDLADSIFGGLDLVFEIFEPSLKFAANPHQLAKTLFVFVTFFFLVFFFAFLLKFLGFNFLGVRQIGRNENVARKPSNPDANEQHIDRKEMS